MDRWETTSFAEKTDEFSSYIEPIKTGSFTLKTITISPCLQKKQQTTMVFTGHGCAIEKTEIWPDAEIVNVEQ